MNAVARFLLRAKHWQISIVLVGPFLVGEAAAMIFIATTKLSIPDSGKFAVLIGLVTALVMIGDFGWLWSLGAFLSSIVQPALRLKRGFFLFSIVYPLIYVVFFGLSFRSTNPALVAVIFPLHFFAAFCIFYVFYFVSKNLVLAETGRPALFPDYAWEFFLIWFSFAGVWLLQPRVNRLYEQPLPPPAGVEAGDASSRGVTPTSMPAGNAHTIRAGTPPVYAGFWLRAAAALVDGLVTFFPLFIIAFAVTVAVKLVSPVRGYDSTVVMLVAFPASTIVAVWLYSSVLESSPWQATIGKVVLRLYVSDREGRRVTLGRAMCRNLAKCLSNLTLGIGYVLCGFTKKKQALHDILASCLVLRRPNTESKP